MTGTSVRLGQSGFELWKGETNSSAVSGGARTAGGIEMVFGIPGMLIGAIGGSVEATGEGVGGSVEATTGAGVGGFVEVTGAGVGDGKGTSA